MFPIDWRTQVFKKGTGGIFICFYDLSQSEIVGIFTLNICPYYGDNVFPLGQQWQEIS